MDSYLQARIARRLYELERAGLKRRLAPPSGIDLSSNDYLGLAEHPAIKHRMAQAVLDGGCGATGSRLLTGDRTAFSSVERRFARFKGTESVLYFSTGYAANIGVLASFLEAGDVVFSDELNHASLIDGIRLSRAERRVFRHANVDRLKSIIEETACSGQKFLVTESLFSMDGDFAPLAEYADLCERTGTAMIVDEAHAVGIYGKRGSGLIEADAVDCGVFLSINTAGKALGVSGAFVAGPEWAIDYLIQRARTLVFSTAPPPSVADALDEALNIVEREPERRALLLRRSHALRSRLAALGIGATPGDSQIIPIVIGENDRTFAVAAQLQAEGFDVRAIRPPTVPNGTARIRISVNVKVDDGDLDRFADLLAARLNKQAGIALSE